MAVTIKDIAKVVGVTPTTVSMVVRGDKRISIATTEKVQKVIKEMNYRPNYIGRSLVKGRTNVIAIASGFFSNMFTVEIMRGMESKLIPTNYRINQYATRGIMEKEDDMFREILYGARPEALICVSLKPSPEIIAEYNKEGLPVISVEESAGGISTVKTDNEKGAFMAVDYLVKKGRNKIGIVAGKSAGSPGSANSYERLKGYKDALTMHGISFNPERVVEVADYTFEEGLEGFNRMLRRDALFDAVFCAAGDMTAAGIIRRAEEKGIKIPEDLSVIGYDNMVIASIVKPALTTVNQPIFEMGRSSIDLAMDLINKKETVKTITFQPTLVFRASA
jgi:DNA-binding LacI/PurR family transcriptional regulator